MLNSEKKMMHASNVEGSRKGSLTALYTRLSDNIFSRNFSTDKEKFQSFQAQNCFG